MTAAVDIELDDMDELESWVKTNAPREIYFYPVGISARTQSVVVSLGQDEQLVTERSSASQAKSLLVETELWGEPVVLRQGGRVPVSEAGPDGHLEGLEWTTQGSVREDSVSIPRKLRRLFNPARDYIEQRYEISGNAQAPWQEDKAWMDEADPELIKKRWRLSDATRIRDYRYTSTRRVVEYGQTQRGQWYARKILRTYEDNQGERSESVKIIRIDTERDIPDELFDPDSVTAEMFRTPKGQSVTD